jgi:outer membrane receptor protein involved in Fe transport
MLITHGLMAVAVACGALIFAPRARADGESADATDARIRRLEEALKAQAAETDRLRSDFNAYRRQNPSVIAPSQDEIASAVSTYLSNSGASRADRSEIVERPLGGDSIGHGVRWGGYFHWLYKADSKDPTEFSLLRLVLAADAEITDKIDFSSEIEFENGGISDENAGEVVIEKAEVAFHCCDAFTPKLGWLLVPFGRYNRYHDDPMNDFSERPFTADKLVPTGFGQPGIGVEGAMPFGGGHVFSYDVALTNGYKDAFTADEGVRDARHEGDENDGKQVWGRAAVRWDARCALDALETGISGTYGIYDLADRNAITGFAADFLLRKGPFEMRCEYVAYHYDRNAFDPAGSIEGQNALWLEAAWHFMPTSLLCTRNCVTTETSLFTLAVRYEQQDLDDHVRGATFEDDLRAWSVGLNYRVTERTVFRVDHTWFDAETEPDTTRWAMSFSTYF